MPFIRTALLGSPGAPVFPEDEYVNHIGIIRLRVQGSGTLRSTLYSMDDQLSSSLAAITLNSSSEFVREIKSNFNTQRVSLELTTTAIDEIIKVNKIIIFVSSLWKSIPG